MKAYMQNYKSLNSSRPKITSLNNDNKNKNTKINKSQKSEIKSCRSYNEEKILNSVSTTTGFTKSPPSSRRVIRLNYENMIYNRKEFYNSIKNNISKNISNSKNNLNDKNSSSTSRIKINSNSLSCSYNKIDKGKLFLIFF